MRQPLEVDAMAQVYLMALSGMVFLVLLFIRTRWRVSRAEGMVPVAIALARWGFDFSASGPGS